jgi:hypothetical protein
MYEIETDWEMYSIVGTNILQNYFMHENQPLQCDGFQASVLVEITEGRETVIYFMQQGTL